MNWCRCEDHYAMATPDERKQAEGRERELIGEESDPSGCACPTELTFSSNLTSSAHSESTWRP